MIDIENYINDLLDNSLCEVLPPEFDPIMSLFMIPTDPYAKSRKWFVYDDVEDKERYNDDW